MGNTQSDQRHDYVSDVYEAKGDPAQLRQIYDEWSHIYDDELENRHGWRGPEFVASVASKQCSKSDTILDVGAGTGLVGHLLSTQDFNALEAIDLSEGMLAKAKSRGVYRALHLVDLSHPLPFPDRSFDHAVASGVFTYGHVPATTLDDLVRVIRKDGLIIFTLPYTVDDTAGYVHQIKDRIRQLEARHLCVIEEITSPVSLLPNSEPEARHQVWTLRVIAAS